MVRHMLRDKATVPSQLPVPPGCLSKEMCTRPSPRQSMEGTMEAVPLKVSGCRCPRGGSMLQ